MIEQPNGEKSDMSFESKKTIFKNPEMSKKITYRDEDNIDKYMLSVKRKRYNDIMALPDKVPILENFKTLANYEYDYEIKESERIIR
jgi:hypothetical protein